MSGGTGLAAPVVLSLGLLGLIGGVGITAVGPGGVIPTIGLFALTSLSPARVAGTAIVTHVATGVLGTAAYSRSGQLRDAATRRTALLLAATAAAGAPLGVALNAGVSPPVFGVVLGAFVAVVALLVAIRLRLAPASNRHPSAPLTAVIGLGVAAASGVVGVGGPLLTVPLLVTLGTPVLEALAAAQAQSIVIAVVGAVGYAARGAIDWPLAAVVGVPELAGVLLGWRIAHALPTRGLTIALVVVLLLLVPYLVLHG